MTYAEVYDLITKYLYDRTDLTAIVPELVTLAERKLYQRLRVQENQAQDTYQHGDHPTGYTLPVSFITLIAVGIEDTDSATGFRALHQLSAEGWHQQAANALGTPTTFTLQRNTLQVYPLPSDSGAQLRVDYYNDLARATAGDTTNDVLTTYPNLIIHGTLIEAAAYLGEDSRIPIWRQEYEAALQNANAREVEQAMGVGSVQVKAAY